MLAKDCPNKGGLNRCQKCGAEWVCPAGDRYYLSAKLGSETVEREVTVEEFCQAERAAGFRPKLPSSDRFYMTTPATGGFSSGAISGRVASGVMGADEARPVARLHIRLEDDGLAADVEVLDGTLLQPEHSPVDVYLHPAGVAVPRALAPHNVDDVMQLVFKYGAARVDVDRSNSAGNQRACNEAIEAIRTYLRNVGVMGTDGEQR